MASKYRGGNIGKIKYFLPTRIWNEAGKENQRSQLKPTVADCSSIRDDDKNRNLFYGYTGRTASNEKLRLNHFSKRLSRPHDKSCSSAHTSKHQYSVDVDVIGIRDASEIMQTEKKSLLDAFANETEKQEFYDFLEELKHDEDYQNSITMFTVLYYYQKKQGRQPGKGKK